ncbi:MAG: clostripain-related cysteine peptidase [Methanomassiliicoccales archaeon]
MPVKKKLVCTIITFLYISTIFGASLISQSSWGENAIANWTFLVYLDADNNLERYGIEDFLEMASVGSTSQVNIVVQFDRSPLTSWNGGTSSYEDWKGTKRFLVKNGDRPVPFYQLADLGELNMGSPSTLRAFLEWGISSYPAEHYALVLWDHGGGWVYGVCSDETSGGDSLLLPEIRQALISAQQSTGKTLDLLGFDACFMGMFEVAYEFMDLATTVVFSEETEPGQGWPYDRILSSLVSRSSMTSIQLSEVIVREYSEYYGSSGKETLSSVATTALNSLSRALSGFAYELISAWPSYEISIRQARSKAESFEYRMFVDLYDFSLNIKDSGITLSLTASAEQVMSAVEKTVLYERSGSLRADAHGIAIYFPDIVSDLNLIGYRSDSTFTDDNLWDEFLASYFDVGEGLIRPDNYEEDDSYQQSSILYPSQPQYHSITDYGMDIDWAMFNLEQDTEVVLQTSGISGDTELFLYNSSSAPNIEMACDDDGGVRRFSRLAIHLTAGNYFVKVIEKGKDSEIVNYELLMSIPCGRDAYEPDDSPQNASMLLIDSPQEHSIGEKGADVDWARFELFTTQNILIETWGPLGDTRLWLYCHEGGGLFEVAYDDDTGSGLFSMIMEFDLPQGIYYVRVEENYNDEEILKYWLNLTTFSSQDDFEEDDSFQTATLLMPGEEQWHSIGPENKDKDWYVFYLPFPSRVRLETYGPKGDTFLRLYSSSSVPWREIDSDDDSGVGYFSMLEFDLLQAGTYYAVVEAFRGILFFAAEPIPRYGIYLTTAPSPPDLHMVSVDDDGIQLMWEPSASDGGSPIISYDIMRASISGSTTFYRSITATSFLDVNISEGAKYYYTVRARSSFAKSERSNEVTAVIPGLLNIPDPISSVGIECYWNSIVLSWRPPSDNGSPILLYHIFCGLEEDGSDRQEVGMTSNITFIHAGLDRETTYYYWVIAENGNGMGLLGSSTKAVTRYDFDESGATTLFYILLVLAMVLAISILFFMLFIAFKPKKPESKIMKEKPFQGHQIFCPNCGWNVEGHTYCSRCGRKVS